MTLLPDSLTKSRENQINFLLGMFVLVFSLIIYLITVQRTLSFWDCGEYIAASYLLGNPHPPGNPLFTLIGRIFSLLPLAADIGLRINLLSCISTAFASMFGYFSVVKLVKEWYKGEWNSWQRAGAYVGGLIGAFFMSFSMTNWNSALEAEVYGPAMLFIVLIFWLALVWVEKRDQSDSGKYLIIIAFLATLSFAIHLTTYLIMPMIILLFLIVDNKLRKDWRFLVTVGILLMLIVSLTWYWILGTIWLVVSLGSLLFTGKRKWQLSAFMMIAIALAFAIQIYTPIRAQHAPAINENNPKDFTSFVNFLERKQYGQKSMIARMFVRRGELSNQFGVHDRMGFWGFFWEQYGIKKQLFNFTLFPLGLIGLGELLHRRWKKGFPFLLMVVASTLGLVLYMNFADGTMQGLLGGDDAHLEVRDRDYFFQPGFILFAMAIGLGFSALYDMLYSAIRKNKGMVKVVMPIALLAVFLPGFALANNYFMMDRSRNFIPNDYAYNLLTSADENAVVFTNGDNDTFPVWCLQEVYGYRQDVRIVNLSLLNTQWYIKQLKHEMGVPIGMSDAEIDFLSHRRGPDGRIIRVQDLMIDEIITTNRFRDPIHFSVTVSESNRQFNRRPIEDYLELKGMMYRLKEKPEKNMVDFEATKDLYLNKFRYSGVADTTIYKDENSRRLTNNYAAGFIFAADVMRKHDMNDDAIEMVKKAVEVVPKAWQSYGYLVQIYMDMDSMRLASEVLETAPENVDLAQVWSMMADTYWGKNRKEEAFSLLNKQLEKDPDNRTAYSQLLAFYYRDKKYDSLENVLLRWSEKHPNDQDALNALSDIRKLKTADTSNTSIKVKQVDIPSDS